MDHLATKERVVIGKGWEDFSRIDLNENYGYNLQESTFHEDCKEKTDCWLITKSGNPLRCAIKVRLNNEGLLETKKTDILVSLYDPFFGIDHPDTKIGRDMIYDYALYISVISQLHRVAKGKVVKNICNNMLVEGSELVSKLKPQFRGKYPKIIFDSSTHFRCQIWLHYDAKTGIPKLLGFVNPKALKVNKEIKYHKFNC
jgi:hypothetical protein